MKFIVLNPHFQDSAAFAKLAKLGVQFLVCADLREADLVLKIHGTSLSLIIGHDEDGLQLNKIAKSTLGFAGLPVILSLSRWTSEQCAEHQDGPDGANAYLRIPVTEGDWLQVVDAVVGTQFSLGRATEQSSIVGESLDPKSAPVLGAEVFQSPPAPVATSSRKSAPKEPAADEEISLDSLFSGGELGDLLESSGPKPPEDPVPTAEGEAPGVHAQAILGDSPFGAGVELPVAPPVETEASPGIDFNLDDLGPNPLEGLDLTSDADGEAPIDPNESDASEREERTDPALDPGELSLDDGDAEPEVDGHTIDFRSQRAPKPKRKKSRETDDRGTVDDDALVEMPYLSSAARKKHSPLQSHVALNDALVPGGSASPPDTETLKKYLALRELDVATLSQQLQESSEHIAKVEAELRQNKTDNGELTYLVQEQEGRIRNFEKEKQIALESSTTEIQELKFEMKKRVDKIRLLEIQVREASQETEKIKDRVRSDIRKIRSREKELENRLEIMRKDSEALLAARENRIIELKRKLDLIEFNSDILQNQYEKEKQMTAAFREKLAKAAQVVRVAEGLLMPGESLDLGDILTQDLVNKDDKTRVA